MPVSLMETPETLTTVRRPLAENMTMPKDVKPTNNRSYPVSFDSEQLEELDKLIGRLQEEIKTLEKRNTVQRETRRVRTAPSDVGRVQPEPVVIHRVSRLERRIEVLDRNLQGRAEGISA